MPSVAVASSSRLAAEAGSTVASSGGNAVDAAVAALMVSLVAEPGICSIGGAAFITIWGPDDDPVMVDGNVTAPGRGLPTDHEASTVTVSTEYAGGMTTTVGHGSVAVPGAPAALELAVERFGRAGWADVLAPSIAIARDGFALPAASDHYLGFVHDVIYGRQSESRAVLHHPDDRRLAGGETVRIPDLADSLELLAREGSDAFYRGEIAAAICADMEANGGRLTAEDLDAYRAEVREPLRARLDGWRLATNPPPAVGGAAVVALLRLTEGHPSGPWEAEDVARFVDAHRAVIDFRRDEIDQAERPETAIEDLLRRVDGEPGTLLGSPSTVHTSAVDDAGLACAVTASAGYGSGIMAPGTGIWLNNALGEHELLPAGPDELEPGRRLSSNMAPTIIRDDAGRALAIGSPGADRITTAVSQVLASFVRGGMGLEDAVANPRVHVERVEPDALRVGAEPGSPLDDIDLPIRAVDELHMSFGGVAAALRHASGEVEAAADPRRAGGTAVWTAAP